MKALDLEYIRFLNIAGAPVSKSHISAASGIVRIGDYFYVVADDQLQLGIFPVVGSEPGEIFTLFPGTLPEEKEERKKVKPDLEAIVALPSFTDDRHNLLLIPSGSKPNRSKGALVVLDKDGKPESVQEIDFEELFEGLKDTLGTKKLNIEGAVLCEGCLRLFQRGNSTNSFDAIVKLDWNILYSGLTEKHSISAQSILGFKNFDLGSFGGAKITFTDAACLGDDLVLFVAAAEMTEDSYDDGPNAGSILGALHLDSEKNFYLGKRYYLETKPRKFKVEGIWAERVGDEIEAYLVTDDDNAEVPASLFRTRWVLSDP